MKINLKLANGATLEFDGDAEEFERISAFLAEPPESLTATPTRAPGHALVTDKPVVGPQEPLFASPSLEPGAVAERIEKVGANNDQERMTVMGQLAIEVGKEGIDYETIKTLYTELGLRKPAQFPTKTLANARNSGLMVMVKPGFWRPTYRGENFAKGHGRGPAPARRVGPRTKSSGDEDGESD